MKMLMTMLVMSLALVGCGDSDDPVAPVQEEEVVSDVAESDAEVSDSDDNVGNQPSTSTPNTAAHRQLILTPATRAATSGRTIGNSIGNNNIDIHIHAILTPFRGSNASGGGGSPPSTIAIPDLANLGASSASAGSSGNSATILNALDAAVNAVNAARGTLDTSTVANAPTDDSGGIDALGSDSHDSNVNTTSPATADGSAFVTTSSDTSTSTNTTASSSPSFVANSDTGTNPTRSSSDDNNIVVNPVSSFIAVSTSESSCNVPSSPPEINASTFAAAELEEGTNNDIAGWHQSNIGTVGASIAEEEGHRDESSAAIGEDIPNNTTRNGGGRRSSFAAIAGVLRRLSGGVRNNNTSY